MKIYIAKAIKKGDQVQAETKAKEAEVDKKLEELEKKTAEVLELVKKKDE